MAMVPEDLTKFEGGAVLPACGCPEWLRMKAITSINQGCALDPVSPDIGAALVRCGSARREFLGGG